MNGPNLAHGLTFKDVPASRRDFLRRTGMGFGVMGLAGLLQQEGMLGSAAQAATDTANPLTARNPHFAPRAKRVIHLFMNGGPSHIDTFDPKPMLDKYDGKDLPMGNLRTERETGKGMKSPYKFSKYGQSGIEVSEIFRHVGEQIDDVCVIRGMHGDSFNHEPSLMLMNCGETNLIRPSLGSWVTYGLGTENENLPGFIAMCPNGHPIKGPENWQSAFLPGVFQGTHVDTRHEDINRLVANIRNRAGLSRPEQRRQIDLLQQLNYQHAEQREREAALEARIQSYELAYRMQAEATDAFDIAQEPEYIREAYGDSVQARQILIARRLVERGVRYVQVWHGQGQPWDHHDHIADGHRNLANQCSQAIGALIADLRQRGLLEDTLIVWGGEFGRTPTVELPTPGANAGTMSGRDHNHYGFSVWMAGGGVKGGHVHGETDEFGFQAVDGRVHVHDLHATILHLLGFDHEQLTYRHAGRDFRLTDVHGRVAHGVVA